MASISINWAGLVKVAEVSAVFGIGIVAVFSLGVLGLAQVEAARTDGATRSARNAGYALAGLCFAISAAAVGYGLYLLIPQFHGK
jgi:hypothetical protein